MVSTGQMIGMVLAILIPIAVAAFFYRILHKRSSKIETGMAGAAGYGVTGFLWQQLFYLLLVVLITNISWIENTIGNMYVLSACLYGIICSAFVALGLIWGIYLTNQKQHSLYRTTVVGIGFGLGSVVWNLVLVYGMSFYYSLQINSGTFAGAEEMKNSILLTSPAAMYLDSFKCVLLLLIYMGMALLAGDFYLKKNKIAAWGTPVLIQFFISITNTLMKQYMPDAASKVGIYMILIILALYSVYMVLKWLKTGEVVLLPQKTE